MTIKVSESFSATGAEFSIDLEKLKKLIDKNAIAVLAKVQEHFLILVEFLQNASDHVPNYSFGPF